MHDPAYLACADYVTRRFDGFSDGLNEYDLLGWIYAETPLYGDRSFTSL